MWSEGPSPLAGGTPTAPAVCLPLAAASPSTEGMARSPSHESFGTDLSLLSLSSLGSELGRLRAGQRANRSLLQVTVEEVSPNPPPETVASPEARIISMVSLKARLLLLVAYVGSVTVVVTIERYWTSSGYRISDFVHLESTDLLIIVLVLAVIGLLFCAFVVLLGLITVANRFFASYGQLTRPAACNCGDNLPHRRDDGNAIDVSVHPTDTTVAAGGPALVAPHYNVSLMHLTETRRPPAPSCPPPQGSVNYHYPSLQHINQTSPSVVVEPACFARN